MRHYVNYGLVEKRAKSISSDYNKPDCKVYLERATASIRKERFQEAKSDVNQFFHSCECPNNANAYYEGCLQMIQGYSNDYQYANKLANKFVGSILPYISNPDYVVEYVLPRYDLTYHQRMLIECASKQYIMCDRISSNHEKLQEQYDIDDIVESTIGKGVERFAQRICRVIDESCSDQTLSQRLSLTLEEASYDLQKHKALYDSGKLVKYVTEYYLTKRDITDKDRDGMKLVLSENSMITDNDTSSLRYFTEEEYEDNNGSCILRCLNDYIKSDDKDVDTGFGSVIRTMPIGYCHDRSDFCKNFGAVLKFVKDFMLTDDYDISDITRLLRTIPENIYSQMDSVPWTYSRDELDDIVAHYTRALEALDVELSGELEQPIASKYVALKDAYKEAIDKLNELRSFVYTNENVDMIRSINESIDSPISHAYYLNEFKIFKFQNLIKAAMDADKFIKGKGKKLMDKIAGKLTPIKKKKGLKETSLYETITENDTSDICVCSYRIVDESNFWEVQDVLTEVCEQINKNVLGSQSEGKVYYVVNPDTVEIRLEGYSTILLSDDEEKEAKGELSEEDKRRVLEIEHEAAILDSVDIDLYSGIVESIQSRINDIDSARFSSIIEASKYVDTITREDIDKLYSSYSESHTKDTYTESGEIKWAMKNWGHEEAPLNLQMEACNIISSLLESDDEKKAINKKKEEMKKEEDKKTIGDKIREKVPINKDKNNDDKNKKDIKDEKDTKDDGKDGKNIVDKVKEKIKLDRPDESGKNDPHNPFAGVNITNLKLFAKGIKAKLKDASTKEKEISKNLDMDFDRLTKGIKNALVSDRREAIIKGSIIPSFSRCIKTAIALAGISAINPAAGVITAVGGFAASKRLTKKERLLMLDELSTELEVVEKEIAIAERNDNMKKYRKLLAYKKDLQRQYQRIRYNIRIGKDILPGSATGLREE